MISFTPALCRKLWQGAGLWRCWMTARCSPTAPMALSLTTCIFGPCFLLSCALYKSKSLRATAHLTWGGMSYPHIRLHFPGIRGSLKGPVVPFLNCPLIPRKCCLDPSHMAVWWYRERCSVFLQSFAEQGPAWFWPKLFVAFGSRVLWIFATYKPKPGCFHRGMRKERSGLWHEAACSFCSHSQPSLEH